MNMPTFIIVVTFSLDNVEYVGPFFNQTTADQYCAVMEEHLPSGMCSVQELISPIQNRDRKWRSKHVVAR